MKPFYRKINLSKEDIDYIMNQLNNSKVKYSRLVKNEFIDYFDLLCEEYDLSIAKNKDYNKDLPFYDDYLLYTKSYITRLEDLISDLDKKDKEKARIDILTRARYYKMRYLPEYDKFSQEETKHYYQALENSEYKQIINQRKAYNLKNYKESVWKSIRNNKLNT